MSAWRDACVPSVCVFLAVLDNDLVHKTELVALGTLRLDYDHIHVHALALTSSVL